MCGCQFIATAERSGRMDNIECAVSMVRDPKLGVIYVDRHRRTRTKIIDVFM